MKLRAGIIGLGVGEAHIAGYQEHPDCQVTALCDIQESVCQAMRAKYPGIKITQDPGELLTDPSLDVLSIASYDDAHAAQILAALKAGKHVFVEKPFCLYEKEAVAIRKVLLKNPHLKMSSNLILRRYPRFVRLKQLIEEEHLGNLYYLEGDYDYGRLHKLTEGWRGTIDFYSVMSGGGIHLIDLFLWLTHGKVVEVVAYGNQIASRGTQFRYPDLVTALLKFKSGLLAKVTANFGCVYPHFHGVKVYGTSGTFVNGFDQAFFYTSRDRAVLPEAIGGNDEKPPKGAMLSTFVDAILKETSPEVSCDEMFESMSICLAVERSLKTGKPVPVHYY